MSFKKYLMELSESCTTMCPLQPSEKLYLPNLPTSLIVETSSHNGKYNFSEGCNGHIRTFTFKSLIELVTYHGYKIITAKSVPSDSFQKSRLLILFEKLITKIDNKLGSSIILVIKKLSLS